MAPHCCMFENKNLFSLPVYAISFLFLFVSAMYPLIVLFASSMRVPCDGLCVCGKMMGVGGKTYASVSNTTAGSKMLGIADNVPIVFCRSSQNLPYLSPFFFFIPLCW